MPAHRSEAAAISKLPRRPQIQRILLLVAGLGGLLYGIDVGIIGGALPYLQATSHLTAGQSSAIVAACCWVASSPLFSRHPSRLDGPQAADDPERLTFVLSIPSSRYRRDTGRCFSAACCKA